VTRHDFEVLAKPFHPSRLIELLAGDASMASASALCIQASERVYE
jgi:hypothetical protein